MKGVFESATPDLLFCSLTKAKVRIGDFHPTLRYLVTLDDDLQLILYDYSTQSVLCSVSLPFLETEFKDISKSIRLSTISPPFIKRGRVGLSTSDFSSKLENSSESPSTPSTVTAKELGSAISVDFYDENVLLWKKYKETIAPISEVLNPEVGKSRPDYSGLSTKLISRALDSPHWLVITTEHRILLFDYINYSLRSISLSELQASKKSPPSSITSIEILCNSPRIAIGCSDGTIRLWDLNKWGIVGTLSQPNSSKPITVLKSFTPRFSLSASTMSSSSDSNTISDDYLLENTPQFLFSGSTDGSIILWNTQACTKEDVFAKAHDSIAGLSWNPYTQELVSTGGDKSIKVFEVTSSRDSKRLYKKEKAHIKPKLGKPFISVSHFSHPSFSMDAVIVACKHASVYAFVSEEKGKGETELFELTIADDFFTKPLKSAAKASGISIDKKATLPEIRVYSALVHPLHPSTLALLTSVGIAVVSVETFASPSSAVLPPRLQVDSSSAGSGGSSGGALVSNYSLLYFETRQVVSLLTLTDNPLRGKMKAATKKLHRLQKKDASVEMSVSPSGQYLALIYPILQQYAILSIQDSFSAVDSAACEVFVWSSDPSTDKYAYLEPTITPSTSASTSTPSRASRSSKAGTLKGRRTSVAMGSVSGSGRKSMDMAGAGSRGTYRFPSLKIKSINKQTGKAETISENLTTPQIASSLLGGSLLGVVYGLRMEGLSDTFPVQFFDWESLKPVENVVTGTDSASDRGYFPKPNFVRFDPDGQYMMLAYDSDFVVYSVDNNNDSPNHSRLKFIAKQAFQITDALWWNASLFFVTHEEIRLLLVSSSSSTSSEYESVLLASSRPDISELAAHMASSQSDISRSGSGGGGDRSKVMGSVGLATQRRPTQLRPAGPISLVNVIDDQLLVIDHYHQLHFISLAHPLLKAKLLISAGYMEAALAWIPFLHPASHGEIASFLESRGFGKEAISLDFVPDWTKFEIAYKHGLFEDAISILDQLARPLLTSSQSHLLPKIGKEGTGTPLHNRIVQGYFDIADLAERESKDGLADSCLFKASQLDARASRAQLFLYSKRNQVDAIANLFDSLIFQKLWEEAILAAMLVNNEQLLQKALFASQSTAEGVSAARYMHDQLGTDLSDANGYINKELLSKWNKAIQPDTNNPLMAGTGISGSLHVSVQELPPLPSKIIERPVIEVSQDQEIEIEEEEIEEEKVEGGEIEEEEVVGNEEEAIQEGIESQSQSQTQVEDESKPKDQPQVEAEAQEVEPEPESEAQEAEPATD